MIIHVVKPGEFLWQIATFYNVPIGEIISVNELPNPNQLLIGQALLIPTEDVFYVVKPGDTLWIIAKNYGTTVNAIMAANRISNPNVIYPSLTLYIPALRHKLRPGETLAQVAQMYGVSLQDLLKVNYIKNPNLVYSGTILVIPRKQRPNIFVNAYTINMGEIGVPSIMEDGEHLTYLTPFAYKIKSDGSLESIDDSPLIKAAYSKNAVPLMSITNFTARETGSDIAHAVLADPAIQERLLENAINIMKTKGYKGLNIDFENVYPADRELYNQFLQRAVNRLHPQGFSVSSALAPKTSSTQKGLLYEAHDYEAHGKIVDFVILMTYEWGYRLGPPQAISPLNEIKRVMDYAVSVIPREKIYFGFQLYARDWLLPHVQGQEAETFSMQEAIARAVKYGTVIQYDPIAQAPFYRYRDEQGRMHEVWFEDARSAQAKFDMVKSYKLAGISYWVLGYPFPQNWVLLEDNFTVKKLV